MKLVNLTNHDISKFRTCDVVPRKGKDGYDAGNALPEVILAPCGRVARVRNDTPSLFLVVSDDVEWSVVRPAVRGIDNLPEPEEGTLYIVSSRVADAALRLHGRRDCVSPHGLVFSTEGRLVGCTMLIGPTETSDEV